MFEEWITKGQQFLLEQQVALKERGLAGRLYGALVDQQFNESHLPSRQAILLEFKETAESQGLNMGKVLANVVNRAYQPEARRVSPLSAEFAMESDLSGLLTLTDYNRQAIASEQGLDLDEIYTVENVLHNPAGET